MKTTNINKSVHLRNRNRRCAFVHGCIYLTEDSVHYKQRNGELIKRGASVGTAMATLLCACTLHCVWCPWHHRPGLFNPARFACVCASCPSRHQHHPPDCSQFNRPGHPRLGFVPGRADATLSNRRLLYSCIQWD